MIQNNMNAIRLTAAGMVLFGHSFAFHGMREPHVFPWAPLGPVGVYIFFIISGYLVSESWDRDPNLLRFFQRRLLRIIPGLAVCILFTIFVLGPLLTTLSLTDYFTHEYTWGYLKNIALYIVYQLPGVFENNKVPNAINGSIWSLPVEFLMYVVVAILGFMHGNRWLFLAMAVASAITCLLWANVTKEVIVFYNFDVKYIFICGIYFWVGACFYKFKLLRFVTLSIGMLALLALLFLEPYARQLTWAAWILLPIAVLTCGFSFSPILGKLTSSGDYSYGVYIYAFPVQQAVVYLWPQLSISNYIIFCSFITLILAITSWHLVESRALAFKPLRPTFINPPDINSPDTEVVFRT
jgi:peptidoglycan/LPS O-acetylase OafA/YrhL